MTYDEIRHRQLAVPFVPYTLFLADSREVEVAHPEVLAIEAEGRTLVLYDRTDFGEVIDLKLIVSLRYKIEEFLREDSSSA